MNRLEARRQRRLKRRAKKHRNAGTAAAAPAAVPACQCSPCLSAGESRDSKVYCDDCGGIVRDVDAVAVVVGGNWSKHW